MSENAAPEFSAPASETAAVCAVHPEALAVGNCTRCGAFYCEEDRVVLAAGGFCASCGARADVDHLEAFRQQYWGKRDGWAYLSALWFVFNVAAAVIGAQADDGLTMVLGLGGAGVCAGYFFLLPWARIGLIIVNAASLVTGLANHPSLA